MNRQQALFTQLPVPWKPHEYQKKSVKFLLEHAMGGLFLDPGLGKTSITYAAIKILKKRRVVNKVLIIAPLRVCQMVWPAEKEKWKDFNDLRVVVLHGPNKNEALKTKADIYLINPEGLEWLFKFIKVKTPKGKTTIRVDRKYAKKLGFDLLVVDELSKFKHTSTNRFKGLKQILDLFGRRWGLTGSPAANGLLDLFGQMYVLDRGVSLGAYITHYRNNYFLPGFDGYSWVLQNGASEKIYKRIAPYVLRMAADDYLKLPKLVPASNITVELGNDARSIYEAMEEELFTQIKDKRVTAANAAVAMDKCRQIANGGVFITPDIKDRLALKKIRREWVNIHNAKTDALLDLIDELQGQPLLVAYEYAHDIERLREKFGNNLPVIGGAGTAGRMSNARLKEIINEWNAGNIPLLAVQPQSGAYGLNLQAAGHHVVFHSLTWNYEHYDQLIRRIWRQGNRASHVFVHHIIARATVDEVVLATIRAKGSTQQALFSALQRYGQQRRRRN